LSDLGGEDRVLREHLATVGAYALRELAGVLNAPQAHRDESCARAVPTELGNLARLIAMADQTKSCGFGRSTRSESCVPTESAISRHSSPSPSQHVQTIRPAGVLVVGTTTYDA